MEQAPPAPDRRPGLRAEQRSVADSRIIDGAMAVFAERGLEGTIDDVSSASGVSRRTVFRHFESHGELFAAAISRILVIFEERLPGPPGPGQDCAGWLHDVAHTVHELNRDLLGRGWSSVHADGVATGPEIRAVLSSVAERRRRMADRLAQAAWQSEELAGGPPSWVVEAFAGALSEFGTGPGSEGPALHARILVAVVAQAAAERRAGGPAAR